MQRPFDRPLIWASLAVLLTLGWQFVTVQANYDGNWTGLFRIGSEKPIPDYLVASTFRNAHPSGYDGQFYRLLAHDPFLKDDFAAYTDNPPLRARRILVPLVAWLLAGGRHQAIDGVYIFLIAASVFAGVYCLARIMEHHGRSPAWGLSFFAVPAVLIGIDTLTVDVALAAAMAYFVWQVQSGGRRGLWLVAAAAPLIRETGLVLAGASAFDAVRRRDWLRALLWHSATIPFFAWTFYVESSFPQVQLGQRVMIPSQYFPHLSVGVLQMFLSPQSYPNLTPTVEHVVRFLDRVCLLGVMIAALLGIWRLRETKGNEMKLLLGAFVLAVPALSAPQLWEPVYSYGRVLSPLFLLLLISCSEKLRGPLFASPAVVCLMVDLRVSAEVLTQVLGILSWLGLR